jgi:hypothetical protein
MNGDPLFVKPELIFKMRCWKHVDPSRDSTSISVTVPNHAWSLFGDDYLDYEVQEDPSVIAKAIATALANHP